MTGGSPDAKYVLVVEDHELIAESLAVALRAEQFRVELADLSDKESLIASVHHDPPDVAMVDLELGGAIGDGTCLIRPFTQAGTRVLVVTGVSDRARLGSAVERGAVGVLSKRVPFEELLATLLSVSRGEDAISPQERHELVSELERVRRQARALREPFLRLTPREQQVLYALGQGMSVGQIARDWVVSEATVRSQVRGVLMKLGVTSQLEAVAYAAKAGWFAPTH